MCPTPHQGRHVPLSGHTWVCPYRRMPRWLSLSKPGHGSHVTAHAQSAHSVGVDLCVNPGLCVQPRTRAETWVCPYRRMPRWLSLSKPGQGKHVGLLLPPDVLVRGAKTAT